MQRDHAAGLQNLRRRVVENRGCRSPNAAASRSTRAARGCDGLRRIDSGTAILPTSCMRLAWRISSTSAGGSFRPRAMTALYSLMRWMCRAGDLVFVLGEDGEPLDGLELRLIGQPLRFGHLLERLAQAGGALLAHRLRGAPDSASARPAPPSSSAATSTARAARFRRPAWR